MKRGGIGILIVLIVALLVAFLFTKQMQSKTTISEQLMGVESSAVQAAESAVDTLNDAIQTSGLGEKLQGVISQLGGNG